MPPVDMGNIPHSTKMEGMGYEDEVEQPERGQPIGEVVLPPTLATVYIKQELPEDEENATPTVTGEP